MRLFKELGQKYIAEAGRIRTPASEASFMKVMRLCQNQYPDHHLVDFTGEDLTAFCLSRGAAPSTVKNRKSHIISVFNWCAYKRLIQSNPAVDLPFTVPSSNGRVRLGNWLTEAEASSIFQSFDMNDQKARRDRLVFMIGIMLGLRVFEIASLRWEMFTDDLSTLRIKGKGDKLVDLTVPAQLQRELAGWHRERIMGAAGVIPGFRWHWDPALSKRVRVCLWDKPLTDQAFRYIVQEAGDMIGRKLTPHDLRRSFAGILEEKNVSLRDIQLAMRHSNLSTTDRYLQANPARLAKVMTDMRWDF